MVMPNRQRQVTCAQFVKFIALREVAEQATGRLLREDGPQEVRRAATAGVRVPGQRGAAALMRGCRAVITARVFADA